MEFLAIIVLFCLLFPSIIGRTVADGVHAYEVKRLATSAWDIVEGLNKAINFHDDEVARFKQQIVENDRYGERVRKTDPNYRSDGSANAHCATKIEWHTAEAKRLRDIMVML